MSDALDIINLFDDEELKQQETLYIDNYENFANNMTFLNNNFNILHLNIRSIRKNFDSFLVFISQIKLNAQVIVLSETWLSSKDGSPFLIPGYKTYHSYAVFNQNDGVSVFIKDNLLSSFKILNIPHCNSSLINIKLKTSTYNILCLYRSPSRNVKLFLESLSSFLESFIQQHPNSQSYLIGDINIDLHSSEPNSLDYLSLMASYGFYSKINATTRTRTSGLSVPSINNTVNLPNSQPSFGTCIDHIWSNNSDNSQGVVVSCDVTDHDLTFVSIREQDESFKNSKSGSFSKQILDFETLGSDLEKENWGNVTNCMDANASAENFVNSLKHYIKKNTKVKNYNIKSNSKLKPWMTDEILTEINIRNKLFAKLKKQPFNVNLKNQYKLLRNKVNGMIVETKRIYFQKKFDGVKNNSKEMWKTINVVTENVRVSKPITEIYDEDGSIINQNDMKKLTNRFNSFFANVGEAMASAIPHVQKTFEADINPESMMLTRIGHDVVDKLLSELKANSAPGPDGISPGVLKMFKVHLVRPLTHIINLCFTSGVFPTIFKESVIIPLYKKSDHKDVSNYRPISLTSAIAKIIEKAFKKKLINFLESCHYLASQQFGFREGKSTDDAIMKLISEIYKCLNDREKILSIFIDFQKAFDSISHKKLLLKLQSAGVRGVALEFMKSYLDRRTSVVRINNCLSDPATIKFGVPQGTVLGPILFIIYINDIFKLKLRGSVICFADDTCINVKAGTWSELFKIAESDINLIKQWTDFNLLTMNISKTNYLTYSLNKKGQPKNLEIRIKDSDHVLTKVSEITYLGVIIDENLKWQSQISKTITRIRRTIYKFRELRKYLNTQILRQVYYAIIQSVLQYAISAWGGANFTLIQQLERTLQILIRVALRKNRRYSSNLLYSEFNVPTINITYKRSLLAHVGKLTESQLPITSVESHSYGTRSKTDCRLSHIQVNKSVMYHSPLFSAIKYFNELPLQIKQLRGTKKFNQEVKKWLSRAN